MNKDSIRIAFAVALTLWFGQAVSSTAQSPQTTQDSKDELRFVLVLTRHGVRSPTWTNERLDEYSKQPWPQWPVAPGILTPHGRQLMTLFGSYYRARFSEQRVLSASGCGDAAKVYLWADTDERTRETGAGLAEGIMPGCHVEVHALAGNSQDPLFHAIRKPETAQVQTAFAALSGRIGNHPEALAGAYRQPLITMQEALFGCIEAACSALGKKSLLAAQPSLTTGSGDHLAELKGPLTTAATFAENLQLEYLEGMPEAQVGWGKVDGANVLSLMALHAASSDLVQRTPSIARMQASHLLETILLTLQQAESGKNVNGAIGSADERVVFLVGHDTNISNVAALLDAHWLIEGYQRDDAAPGGALVFELWRRPGKLDAISLHYLVQTPDQMRHTMPLSLTAAPASATIFMPMCSRTDPDSSCSWDAFSESIRASLGQR